VLASGHVVLALETGSDLAVEAWTASGGEPAWRTVLEGLRGPAAMMSMDETVLVNTASGRLVSLEAGSGEPRWTHRLTDQGTVELPLSLEPVLRDGGLFVPFDTTYVINPLDGTLLHRLEAASPVPDLLRVDENYSIYTAEVSGHLSAYGVVGHLNVVRS
jgi:outer membrane protein assembly factor BamB